MENNAFSHVCSSLGAAAEQKTRRNCEMQQLRGNKTPKRNHFNINFSSRGRGRNGDEEEHECLRWGMATIKCVLFLNTMCSAQPICQTGDCNISLSIIHVQPLELLYFPFPAFFALQQHIFNNSHAKNVWKLLVLLNGVLALSFPHKKEISIKL